MLFQFTDAQWLSLSSAIAKLGSDPSYKTREQLEIDINQIFTRDKDDDEMIAALRRVRDTAHDLSKALTDLAQISERQDHRNRSTGNKVATNDAIATLEFAEQVRQYGEGADWTLDKAYRAYNEVPRGRPTDRALLSWTSSVLRVAKQEKWVTEDHVGRTSAGFMDLVVELASYAKAAGVTHLRDRRSLMRAVARAREEERASREAKLKDEQDAARISAELDALIRP